MLANLRRMRNELSDDSLHFAMVSRRRQAAIVAVSVHCGQPRTCTTACTELTALRNHALLIALPHMFQVTFTFQRHCYSL